MTASHESRISFPNASEFASIHPCFWNLPLTYESRRTRVIRVRRSQKVEPQTNHASPFWIFALKQLTQVYCAQLVSNRGVVSFASCVFCVFDFCPHLFKGWTSSTASACSGADGDLRFFDSAGVFQSG